MPRPLGSPQAAELLTARYGASPFRVEDALATTAVTQRMLRSACAAGVFVRLRPGVLIRTEALAGLTADDQHLVAAQAALLWWGPDARLGGRSAGIAWGLPYGLAAAAPDAIDLVVPDGPDRVSRVPADSLPVRVRGHRVDAADRAQVRGLPVTGVADTAVDLARGAAPSRVLVPLDAAMSLLVGRSRRRPGLEAMAEKARRDLRDAADRMAHWPGIGVVRDYLPHACPWAESALESSSRGTFLAAGLPVPEVGVPVEGDDGRTYWADLLWRTQRVIGEADGWGKYGDDPQTALRREKDREDSLRRKGFTVVRWTSTELLRDPFRVVERVDRALRHTW